ncbi:Oligosaccharyl transferase STT3 subunit [uncultured archaeon]|nr:Oligosaccharyl transferase STT3 subunit [uncultured archaeon]
METPSGGEKADNSHSEHAHALHEHAVEHAHAVHEHHKEHSSEQHTQHSEHTHSLSHHTQVSSSEGSAFDKAKAFLWKHRVIIVLLIAIFLIAFGIRGHLLRYHYLFEFDAFYHARLVEELVTTGHIISPDPMVYYEVAGGVAAQPWSLYHSISQAFYYLVSIGQSYSKDTLMWSMQINPVIFGSLICILMYFLGKEVFNSRKIGLFTAFVAAVTPAFAYRTMAGAQGDNAFGFLWMVIGFIFFVRAVKNNSLDRSALINTAVAGIFFGLMAMTWRMYLLIPLIVIGYFIFGIILIASNQEEASTKLKKNHAFAFFVKTLITMAIFHVISYMYGEDWIGDALGYVGSAVHMSSTTILIATIIIGAIVTIASVFYISKLKPETKKYLPFLIVLVLYASVVIIALMFATVPDLVDRTTIQSMVGEEAVGHNFFGTKYNELILFPLLALIIFPLSLWLFREKKNMHLGIIFFLWVLITLFMAWYKLKFTFVFGLAIAPAAAMAIYVMLEGLKKFEISKGLEAKIIFVVIFLLVVLGVGASARFFPDYVPYVDENPQWQAAQQWIITNTPADAKFFNWWDQGHILAFTTDRKYSTDNRNASEWANKELAEFVITTDTNRGYTIAAKEIGADYLLLDSSMFNDAPTFEFYVAGKVDSKLAQKYSAGTYRVLNCSPPTSTAVSCEGNSIGISDWNKLSTTWKQVPDDFQNGSLPLFYYKTNDQLIVLNQPMNNINLAKIWTNSEETSKYYEQVYSNSGIKIFKIKK